MNVLETIICVFLIVVLVATLFNYPRETITFGKCYVKSVFVTINKIYSFFKGYTDNNINETGNNSDKPD